MMDLTDYSSQLCKELGLSGFVAYLLAFLKSLSKTTLLNEVIVTIITIIMFISIIQKRAMTYIKHMLFMYTKCVNS